VHEFDIRIMLQICGALLYITNYLLVQTHKIHATKPASLGLVVSACAILLSAAIIGHDYGLILLEGTWLVLVAGTILIRHRAASRKAVLMREAEVSAVSPMRPAAASTVEVEAPVVRERELAGAAA
jgi:hypothetical protein